MVYSKEKYFNKIKSLSSDQLELLCCCQDLLISFHDYRSLSIDYLFDDFLEMKRQSYLIKNKKMISKFPSCKNCLFASQEFCCEGCSVPHKSLWKGSCLHFVKK